MDFVLNWLLVSPSKVSLCKRDQISIHILVLFSLKQKIAHYTHSSEPCFSHLTIYLGHLSIPVLEVSSFFHTAV